MLSSISIRNFVLIDAVDAEFKPGLSVLTGETGAGKSIILESLDLVLGGRADRSLIRVGAEQASVAARFDVAAKHPVLALLAEAGLAGADEGILLRRTVSASGQSRAFINDAPVSAQLLRAVGEALVEIHGQHDERGLLDPAGHRDLLDAFAGHGTLRARMAAAHEAWRAAAAAREAHGERQRLLGAEADYLTHAAEELGALAPEAGEEVKLAEERALLANAARIASEIEDALSGLGSDFGTRLAPALRRLERIDPAAQKLVAPAVQALERTMLEAREAEAQLGAALASLQHRPERLAAIEDRLHALRAAARKYRVSVDALAEKRAEIDAALAAFAHGAEDGAALVADEAAKRTAALATAAELSKARAKAAVRLDAEVNRELAPLKLGKAAFATSLVALDSGSLLPAGLERVTFEVATNPSAPAGALKAIASGGELSRFILALKVVLAREGSATTLVFDEIDRGIGGAVADAVGERLARLARGAQVLVVTHSPQVAARAEHHFLVSKAVAKGAARAAIVELDAAARAEEVARMLSGAKVTDEARAAAASLLEAREGVPPPRRRRAST